MSGTVAATWSCLPDSVNAWRVPHRTGRDEADIHRMSTSYRKPSHKRVYIKTDRFKWLDWDGRQISRRDLDGKSDQEAVEILVEQRNNLATEEEEQQQQRQRDREAGASLQRQQPKCGFHTCHETKEGEALTFV